MSERVYDSQSMMNAKKAIDEAASQVNMAIKSMDGIDLSAMAGATRREMERQISSKRALLAETKKNLETCSGVIASKISALMK